MPAGDSEPGAAEPGRADGATGIGVGFCGKLPSHGDFLHRRLPAPLVGRWDDWLDAGLGASREALGEGWRERYLLSPIRRFAISAGCCGNEALAGILMPSVDRVGRYYPLTIMAMLPEDSAPASLAFAATDWYAAIEELALSCLTDGFDFDGFDARLAAMPVPTGIAVWPEESGFACVDPEIGIEQALPALLATLLQTGNAPYTLWWTVGAAGLGARCRAYPGLPASAAFVDLLLPPVAETG